MVLQKKMLSIDDYVLTLVFEFTKGYTREFSSTAVKFEISEYHYEIRMIHLL